MVRAAQAEKSARKSAKLEQLEQMHFKLRVLDLLDVMARKQPPSPLLLLLPRPLLDAMAQNSARPEQRALLDRCSSLLRHRLCKLHLAKADPWDAKALPPDSLLAEMQQVLHLAEKFRGGGPLLAAAIMESLLLYTRVLSQHGLVAPMHAASGGDLPGAAEESTSTPAAKASRGKRPNGSTGSAGGSSGVAELTSQLVATLHEALSKFYTQKNCRLNTRFATELMRRQPALGWCLAPLVVQHVGEARDAYLCGEACNHLTTLVQQKHALGGPSAAYLLPHVAPLQQQLLAFLARDGLKAKHLLPPLKLAHALLLALRSAQAAPAASVGEAIMGALEALQLKHPEATSRGAVGGRQEGQQEGEGVGRARRAGGGWLCVLLRCRAVGTLVDLGGRRAGSRYHGRGV